MKNVICIVPSKIDRIFRIFATAYMETVKHQLIVIDGDGLSDGIKEEFSDFTYIDAPSPFAIYKAFNEGFKLAGDADVVTMTDDVYIHTANIIEKLQKVAYADDNIGITVPLFQSDFTENQWIRNQERKTEYVDWIPYVRTIEKACMDLAYIRRDLLDKVGLMDEKFRWHRGDADFSLRVLEAGYQHAICYATFAQHGGPLFGRPFENTIFDQNIDTGPDRKYWEEKWDTPHFNIPKKYNWMRDAPKKPVFNAEESRIYYNKIMPGFKNTWLSKPILEAREEFIAKMVKGYGGSAMDFGCGNGQLLTWLKMNDYISDGLGIDISDTMIEKASKTALNNNAELKFICSPIESLNVDSLLPFNIIIASEVLEHLFNVDSCLKKINGYLSDEGVFVGSVPSESQCYSGDHLHSFSLETLKHLLKQYFSDVVVETFDYSQQSSTQYEEETGPKHLVFYCGKSNRI